MRRHGLVLVAAVLAALALRVGTADALQTSDCTGSGMHPAWAPDGQRLVYVSWRARSRLICVINADGTGPAPVTPTGQYLHPAWSPDRSRITFVTDLGDLAEIHAVSPAGSDRRRLTSGRRIAFRSIAPGQALYIMNADGSGVQRVPVPGIVRRPNWSPEGQRIAFVREKDNEFQVYVTRVDGRETMPLTSSGSASDPTWSPDGRRIAFSFHVPGRFPAQILVADQDGSNRRQLTTEPADSPAWSGTPIWSPDGLSIAYLSNRHSSNSNVWIMNADGSGQRQLTSFSGNESVQELVWAPDGRRIAFATPGSVWVIFPDGSGLKCLTGP